MTPSAYKLPILLFRVRSVLRSSSHVHLNIKHQILPHAHSPLHTVSGSAFILVKPKIASCSEFRTQMDRNERHLSTKHIADWNTRSLFSRLTSLFNANPFFGHQHINYSKKAKSKKKSNNSKRKAEDDSDDDSEDEEDSDVESDEDGELDGAVKGAKDLKMNVPSLRLDAVLSAGLGTSRKKIEDAFLNGRLRVNAKRATKKSKQVAEGDVLDLVKEDRAAAEAGEQGGAGVVVMRVEVRRIKDEKTATDKTPVKLRRWKHLVIPKEK